MAGSKPSIPASPGTEVEFFRWVDMYTDQLQQSKKASIPKGGAIKYILQATTLEECAIVRSVELAHTPKS